MLVSVVAVTATVLAGEPVKTAPVAASASAAKSYVTGNWLVQETADFRIYCPKTLPDARKLPESCEALRRQLQETWFGNAAAAWQPRCDIVVHSTVAGYVRELGPGSRQSSGCATIEIEKGRVARRRIDLRADADDWLITALPHELTHVVLADKFAHRQIPRWADEGMAILAEPAGKQTIRRRAMERAMSAGARFGAGDLFGVKDYPAADRCDAFYGQSASLVAYLIERESPARFLEFLEAAQTEGTDRALQKFYQIQSVAMLDARWRPQILDRGQSAELLASRIAAITAGIQPN